MSVFIKDGGSELRHGRWQYAYLKEADRAWFRMSANGMVRPCSCPASK